MIEHNHQDTDLLQEVFKGASIGERGAGLMLEKARDGGLSAKLTDYMREYMTIKQEAAQQLADHGQTPTPPGMTERHAQWLGIQLETLMDKTPAHMAEIRMEDNVKNLIKDIEAIKRNHDTSQPTRELAGRLVRLENDSFNAMKTYLS
ncbi:MAG: hypothetical protein FWE32_05150 [Oscillospiraceae bacterium]|nr:hypothetical protein [Oscillospiraceae bacterium]